MNNPDNFAPYRRGIILINVAKLFGGKGPFHKISYVFYKIDGHIQLHKENEDQGNRMKN